MSFGGELCRRFKTIFFGCAAIFLLLVPSACKKQSEGQEDISIKKLKTLSIGNGREPVTLDPHLAASWADLRVIEGLFEALVVIDPVSKEPIEGVAREWESWNNGLEWRFIIREDAKWSDGTAVTAHDFVQSAERMLNPEFGSDIVVHFLYPLKHAEAYHLGEMNAFDRVGIVAESSHALRLELDYSSPAFLTQLSYFFPVNRSSIEEGRYFDGRIQWGAGGARISNGAFRLADWVTNESILLEKNPFYWDAASVSLDRVQVLPIEDVIAEERAFRSGQIHVTSKVPAGKVQWYLDNDPDQLRLDPRLGLFFLQLNHEVAPLQNVDVRKALAKSIDREELVRSVLRDGKKGADFIVPPDFVGREWGSSPLSFDVLEAQKLLESAGYPGGEGFPKLTFSINTSVAYQALAEAVQFGWKKHLGIEVEIENQEWKTFLSSVENRDYEIARYGYVPLYPDAYPLFQIFTSMGTENFTGWSHPGYDALIGQAKSEFDTGKRNELLREAEGILLGDAPIIPIFFYNSAYLLNPSVEGWHPDLMDRHPLKFVNTHLK